MSGHDTHTDTYYAARMRLDAAHRLSDESRSVYLPVPNGKPDPYVDFRHDNSVYVSFTLGVAPLSLRHLCLPVKGTDAHWVPQSPNDDGNAAVRHIIRDCEHRRELRALARQFSDESSEYERSEPDIAERLQYAAARYYLDNAANWLLTDYPLD